MTAVVSDQDVFQQFTNAKSHKQYQRTWSQFVDFCGDFDFEAGQLQQKLRHERVAGVTHEKGARRIRQRAQTGALRRHSDCIQYWIAQTDELCHQSYFILKLD